MALNKIVNLTQNGEPHSVGQVIADAVEYSDEIRQIAFVALCSDGSVASCFSSGDDNDTLRLLGAISILERRLVEEWRNGDD